MKNEGGVKWELAQIYLRDHVEFCDKFTKFISFDYKQSTKAN